MNLPAGWTEGHDGQLACPHRDLSVCPPCREPDAVVEVAGVHFWIPNADDRRALQCEIEGRPQLTVVR